MKTINRNNEINVIAYEIPNSNNIIIGKMPNGDFVVKTAWGIAIYNASEMEEIYHINTSEIDLERLTWSA